MSKKKSQARQQRRATARQERIVRNQEPPTPIDHEQERAAIRTLIIGATLVALFTAFFGFEVGGKTLYARLFAGGGEAAATEAGAAPKKP